MKLDRSAGSILSDLIWKVLQFTGIGVLFIWSTSAWAYIPPSQFILKTWLNKHHGVKNLKLKTTVVGYDGDKPTSIKFNEIILFNLENQTFRSWVMDDHDKKLYQLEKSTDFLPPITQLLMSADLGHMSRILKERKIPIRTDEDLAVYKTEAEKFKAESLSLLRVDSGVAWVIASGASSSDRPEIWFEKDTFLPLRIAYSDPAESQFVEFRFEGFRSQREFPFPKAISFAKKKSAPLLKASLVEFTVNNEAAVMRQHGGQGESGFTEQGNSAPSQQRNLIRLYYGAFR